MYYEKLIEAKQLVTPEEKVAFFDVYKKEYPRAIAPRRLQLTEAVAQPVFEQLVDEYLRHGLHKGIPPLFVDLRSLYSDQSKADTIEKLILQYLEHLAKSGTFGPEESEQKQPASALLWAYYYAAQHFDYKKDTDRALHYIDAAIEHTPTLIELFIVKGRIYKHAGDPVSAYQWLEEAQAMDTADRYVNSKCARYMLRAGHVKRAEEMCAKFTREGKLVVPSVSLPVAGGTQHAGDPVSAYQWLEEAQAMDTADRYVNSKCARYMLRAGHVKRAEEMCAKFTREGVPATENLNEMQCMWFQTEAAAAYKRLHQWGEALKKAHEVDRHFSEIMEDQFDFHSYCMRKMTLRSYVGLLRLEDVLRAHPFYFRCARVAIAVYLRLYTQPLQDAPQTQEPDTGQLYCSAAIAVYLRLYTQPLQDAPQTQEPDTGQLYCSAAIAVYLRLYTQPLQDAPQTQEPDTGQLYCSAAIAVYLRLYTQPLQDAPQTQEPDTGQLYCSAAIAVYLRLYTQPLQDAPQTQEPDTGQLYCSAAIAVYLRLYTQPLQDAPQTQEPDTGQLYCSAAIAVYLRLYTQLHRGSKSTKS
uniref:Uncharacterized protein n=1 Tax=Heliothis virescens TaxID=7102 RepID=A0A2A4IU32_HELVI